MDSQWIPLRILFKSPLEGLTGGPLFQSGAQVTSMACRATHRPSSGRLMQEP